LRRGAGRNGKQTARRNRGNTLVCCPMYGQYPAVHAPPNPGMPLAHIPALPLAGQCA
jgi:hypothetical protein